PPTPLPTRLLFCFTPPAPPALYTLSLHDALPIYVQRAVGAAEHHEFGTERVDRVRLAVGEVLHEAEAVPPAGEPFRGSADVDRADRACLRHDEPPVPRATVPVNPSVPGNPRPVTGSMCVVVDNGRLRTP